MSELNRIERREREAFRKRVLMSSSDGKRTFIRRDRNMKMDDLPKNHWVNYLLACQAAHRGLINKEESRELKDLDDASFAEQIDRCGGSLEFYILNNKRHPNSYNFVVSEREYWDGLYAVYQMILNKNEDRDNARLARREYEKQRILDRRDRAFKRISAYFSRGA